MSVVKTHENVNGCCPNCDQPMTQDEVFSRLFGHISDGVLYLTCGNCQQELTVEIKLSYDEVLS